MRIKKISRLLFLLMLVHFCFNSLAQSNLDSPIFTWGSGLDGSLYQKTGIYSDTYYGLLFEAPKDASNNRLNISFNWRGAGVPTPLFIQGSTLNVGVGTTQPVTKLQVMDANGGGSPNTPLPTQGILISGHGTGGS
ncbi:MAG: hypothetical protein O9262_07145, partial [Cyclobacteriaceae bacterium]|nr:hypothetical protein [Cyclobacteriaceae bacterium]